MAETEKFDGFLLAMAQQHRGIEPLLASLFGFLRRKTDFLTGASPETVEATVLKVLREQQKIAIYDKKKKDDAAKARKAAAEKYRASKGAEQSSKPAGVTEILRTDVPKVSEVDASGLSPASSPSSAAAATVEPIKPASSGAGESDGGAAAGGSGEAADSKKGLMEPNSGNGLDLGTYQWTQTLRDLTVAVPVRAGVRAKEVQVSWEDGELSIGLKGEEPVLQGTMPHEVEDDDCMWTLEDAEEGGGRLVTVHLAKVNTLEWWGCPVEGEPVVDMQKIEPENSRLEDLDPDTAATVRKMQFDMRAKATGGMTSDQLERQAALERFKQMRPDLDFSNAKINL